MLSGGCSDAAPAGWGPIIDIPVDTTVAPIITVTREWIESVPGVDLEEVARIGDDDSPSTNFDWVNSLTLADDGSIVVLDDAGLRVFSATGTLVRAMGPTGDGPGELRSAGVAITRGDTIFVSDRRGINRFLLDGTYLGRVRISNPPVPGRQAVVNMTPRQLGTTSRGLVAAFHLIGSGDTSPQGITRDTTVVQPLDPMTGARDEAVLTLVSSERHSVGRMGSFPAWYMPEPTWAAADDTLLIRTMTDGRGFDVLSIDGETLRRVVLDAPRHEPEREHIAAGIASVIAFGREQDRNSPDARIPRSEWRALEAGLRGLPVARYRPVVGRILAFPPDAVLAERPDLGESPLPQVGPAERAGSTVWDIITTQGDLSGRIIFPAGFTPRAAAGDVIAGVSRNADDVQVVVTYRARGAGKPGTVR